MQVDGFPSIEDTEIPQLQEHAKKLTESGRASTSRHFLNELSQLLNSMKLWATYDRRVKHSKKDQKVEETFLRARLTNLEKVTLLFDLVVRAFANEVMAGTSYRRGRLLLFVQGHPRRAAVRYL